MKNVFLVQILLLGIIFPINSIAEEYSAKKTFKGFIDDLKGSLALDGSNMKSGVGVSSTGDRSLRNEPESYSQYWGFREYLKDETNSIGESSTPPTRPRIDQYFLFNYFPLINIDEGNDDGLSSVSGSGFYDRGFGYQNSEQMFCDTLRRTLIESDKYEFLAANKTNVEVINSIIHKVGVVWSRGAVSRVKFIEEFGGDLPLQKKKDFLLSILANKSEEVEAIRYFNESESEKFLSSCYSQVGGISEVDPLDFVSPKEDYLLNKIPEVRNQLANEKAKRVFKEAQEAARFSRDRRIELEKQAKEQEAALAHQRALAVRQERDDAEAEKLQQAISQKVREQEALVQKKQSQDQVVREKADAEARKKAALDSLN